MYAYGEVEGQLTDRTIYKSGDQVTGTVKVKRSEIDLNPDLEALGAFTFNLPDGTVIHDFDFPGVRYKIFGGELVPDVDKAVIEQIDRIAEELVAEDRVPAELATANRTEATPNEPATSIDTQPKTQVDTLKTQQEVVAESGSLGTVLVILSGLLIIGVIGWVVFHRLKA